MTEPSDIPTSQCIACKEVIPSGATVCSKCKSYQTRWKNYLQYAAGVVGIFTVVAALFVYIASKTPELKKVLFWSDQVHVISFAYPRDITILNIGDGKILLSHIAIRTARGSTRTLTINKSLDAGEVMTHELEPEEMNRVGEYRVISRLTPQEWSQKMDRYKSPVDPDACTVYTVVLEQDPYYLQFKDYYGKEFQTIGAGLNPTSMSPGAIRK